MAVYTTRRQLIAAGGSLAVQRLRHLLRLIRVTGATIHLGYRRRVRQIFAVERGMARGALQSCVHRTTKVFLVHKERDGSAAALGGHSLVAVARKAVFVRGSGRRETCQRQP